MKKSLTTAITTALVIGAASTTFAAANPFSDVPSDHWSYDAVSKLAQEGVIEGYGDGTFNGNAHITRYEMAQMVAKAMAKTGTLGESDQALVERLAAEYADELNNLGVRVANLEKKSDNVKIEGLLRLDGAQTDMKGWSKEDQDREAKFDDTFKKRNELKALLRLNITAKVNDDWEVKGRLDGSSDLKEGGTSSFTLKRAYAHGTLFGGADVKLGEFGAFDAGNLTNGGLLIDKEMSGAEFKFGNVLKTTLSYGRISESDYLWTDTDEGPTEYGAIQFAYDVNNNLALAAGWHHLKSKASGSWYPGGPSNSNIFPDGQNGYSQNLTDTNNIWTVGFDYKFNEDLTLGGLYAKSDVDAAYSNPVYTSKDDDNETSYSVQLTYKGAKAAVPHSYGVWAAYRQIGAYASINPTYNGALYGAKGYELGVDYMVAKNILAKVVYFDGEYIGDGYNGAQGNNDVNRLFGRLEFSF